jgi:anti-anti-sigma factor
VTDLAQVAIEREDEVVIARVTGELDVAGAPHMRERIADSVPTTARGLVVDFSELEFIDSSGVAMLFALARRLSGRRQRLAVVVPAGGPVARVLEIVEFERAAPVHGELEDALAGFDES